MSKSNIDTATLQLAERWVEIADEISGLQDDLKELKAEAKSDGFNVKVLAQIVKEKRRGAKYQCEQLTLELELDTYRRGTGLPTNVEDAQVAAREAAKDMPEPEKKARRAEGAQGRKARSQGTVN